MTLFEKVDFIQKRSGFGDKKFCKVYGLQLPVLWQIRKGLYQPDKSELAYLCDKFNLDLDDFNDDLFSDDMFTEDVHDDNDENIAYDLKKRMSFMDKDNSFDVKFL